MIGGVDVEIPTRAGRSALELCVRVVLQNWPRAVVDDVTTGGRYRKLCDLPSGTSNEVLVYRDEQTALRWDELGAAPELSNTMVHLLYDPGYVNVVVDDPDTREMSGLLDGLRSVLGSDLFAISPLPKQVAA